MMGLAERPLSRQILLLVFSVWSCTRQVGHAYIQGLASKTSYARNNHRIIIPSTLTAAKRSHFGTSLALAASIAPNQSTTTSELAKECLDLIASDSTKEACQQWASQLGLEVTAPEVAFYGLFLAIRHVAKLGVRDGKPFCLRRKEIIKALDVQDSPFAGFFTIADLAKAVQDDFLDAARGSTDNRKGWKV